MLFILQAIIRPFYVQFFGVESGHDACPNRACVLASARALLQSRALKHDDVVTPLTVSLR